MLPRADLSPTRPPAALDAGSATASSTDVRGEVLRRLSQIAIGRELQATVLSALEDGTYLVNVDDAAARMALPDGARVGDKLSMVFVAREPRPTFLLLNEQGSTPTTLSGTARMISQLLQEQAGAKALEGQAPLLGAPTGNPAIVAGALEKALTSSGLFYEAHLQEWLNGTRSLEDLAAEPQARLPAAQAPNAAAAGARPSELERLAASMHELGDGANRLLDMLKTARSDDASRPGTDADLLSQAPSQAPAVDPASARLVSLQLNALEQQQVRWQGELWPGQKMEWEVGEEGGGAAGSDGQSVWSSTVRFELPHLGNVAATVRLSGDRVSVQVTTPNEASATLLRDNGGTLAGALDAAGSPLDSLLVKRDETP